MFAHENLTVYLRALDFSGTVVEWTAAWDKRHAFVDHFSRASESVLVNTAEAARQRSTPFKLRAADYAIGSTLECAGCMDLARIKGFLTPQRCRDEKSRLCEITSMLFGLRKAWGSEGLRDEGPHLPAPVSSHLFHHERLDIYQAALGFMEWFVSRPTASELSNRLFREIDAAGTSMVLNIAQGNGRFAELDHRRFLHVAQTASVKAAVYLDLCAQKTLLNASEVAVGKDFLRRIGAMVVAL